MRKGWGAERARSVLLLRATCVLALELARGQVSKLVDAMPLVAFCVSLLDQPEVACKDVEPSATGGWWRQLLAVVVLIEEAIVGLSNIGGAHDAQYSHDSPPPTHPGSLPRDPQDGHDTFIICPHL